MEKEYISIKEFARAAGINFQTVYRQLDKRLAPYVQSINGKKRISSEALRVLYGVEYDCSTNIQPNSTKIPPSKKNDSTDIPLKSEKYSTYVLPDSTMDEQPNTTTAKALELTLAALTEQLQQKDKQIESLQATLKLAEENLARSQQLHAADKQRLLALESREEIHSESKMESQETDEENEIWESAVDKEDISEEKGTQAVFVGFKDDETFENNEQVVETDQEPEAKRGFFARLWESIVK